MSQRSRDDGKSEVCVMCCWGEDIYIDNRNSDCGTQQQEEHAKNTIINQSQRDIELQKYRIIFFLILYYRRVFQKKRDVVLCVCVCV